MLIFLIFKILKLIQSCLLTSYLKYVGRFNKIKSIRILHIDNTLPLYNIQYQKKVMLNGLHKVLNLRNKFPR